MPVKLEVPESMATDVGTPPAPPLRPATPAALAGRHDGPRGPLPDRGEPDSWLDAVDRAPDDPSVASVEGTRWTGLDAGTTYWRLDANGVFTYGATDGQSWSNGTWIQRGATLYIATNERYSERLGRIEGDVVRGDFRNRTGFRTTFRMQRAPR